MMIFIDYSNPEADVCLLGIYKFIQDYLQIHRLIFMMID